MSSIERVMSRDGTPIAFERLGDGPPLILVGAALQSRASYHPLAEALSKHVTVFNYDRRGRGDSGDTPPYSVEREVDDLAAVIAEAGGTAAVYGHSSGAALVLHAAARGAPINAMVLHEPPFGSDTEAERQAEREEAERIRVLLSEDRRAEVVATFLSGSGLPPEVVDPLSQDPAMLANAPTLPYDYQVLGAESRGGASPAEQARSVAVPTLVLAGDASPDWMVEAGRGIGDALPNGKLKVLAGQEHVVAPEVLAPVLWEFLVR